MSFKQLIPLAAALIFFLAAIYPKPILVRVLREAHPQRRSSSGRSKAAESGGRATAQSLTGVGPATPLRIEFANALIT